MTKATGADARLRSQAAPPSEVQDMIDALLGRKLEMTQVFQADGRAVPVTAIEVGPCVVVQRKTVGKEGYSAVQLGFTDERKRRRLTRPIKGHFARSQVVPKRTVQEVRVADDAELPAGTVIGLDGVRGIESALAAAGEPGTGSSPVFAVGDKVKVTGTSKGKGFQGAIRRNKFQGGPASHGSRFHRYPGSIGCRSTPGKVNKGRKMPGQMGNKRVTVRNLVVVHVDPANNLLLLRGAVPGARMGLVTIRKDHRFITR